MCLYSLIMASFLKCRIRILANSIDRTFDNIGSGNIVILLINIR